MSLTAAAALKALDTADCLYPAAEVEAAIDRLSEQIRTELAGTEPLVLCALLGGIVLCGKLLTRIGLPLQLDYVHATRYRGETTGGLLHWIAEPRSELQGRVVLIVDDILDEGHTLASLQDYCRRRGAARVYSAVLVEKRRPGKTATATADFIGLPVPDRYVFGYGMDFHGYLRNAPGIYAAAAVESS